MLKGWKTVIFATVMGGIMIVSGWTTPEIAEQAPTGDQVTQTMDLFEVIYGLVVMIGGWFFRAVTNAPIFNKPPAEPAE